MDDAMIRPSMEGERDEELAAELRRLHPLLQRQRRAAAARPDAGFKRALLAQLTSSPRAGPVEGAAASAWHTLIAMLLPSRPQISLRGDSPQLLTYTADDVTISLTARPADGSAGGLISLYGEVDHPAVDQEEPVGTTVEALRGEAIVAATALDDLGNFVLRDLSPRVYALRLRFPDRREVIVPPTSYDAEGETRSE
jgi:hypothetical protein